MSVDDSMRRTIAEQHDEIGALKAENDKLRESNDMLAKMLGDRAADCYKLRELVRDLHYCCSSNDRCHPCPYFSADTECPEPHFSERMRELGIEVDG